MKLSFMVATADIKEGTMVIDSHRLKLIFPLILQRKIIVMNHLLSKSMILLIFFASLSKSLSYLLNLHLLPILVFLFIIYI